MYCQPCLHSYLHRRLLLRRTLPTSFTVVPSETPHSQSPLLLPPPTPPVHQFRQTSSLTLLSPLQLSSKFRSFYQIIGGKDSTLDVTRKNDSKGFTLEANEEEIDWMNLESDIRLWTRALRPVQVMD